MRTTLELPDPLFARLKARAAMKQVSLKQLLHDYVEQGLEAPDPSASQARRSARDLPTLPLICTVTALGLVRLVMPYSVISKPGFPLLRDSPRENWRDGVFI